MTAFLNFFTFPLFHFLPFMAEQQSYTNHTRWFPLVHFVVTPLLLISFGFQIYRFWQEQNLDRLMWIVLVFTIILLSIAARLQALKAQDRVIRLEERLRYREALSSDLAARASNLPTGKIISLRFASDEELPSLVTQVLEGKLSTGKEIKSSIKNWRADHLRV